MQKLGFTLIELSIVLVIIGLVIGGVLVGRDLIKSSEIRAQLSQIAEYNTSVNTFKMKYNYLPGDLPPTEATAVGFSNFNPLLQTRNGSLGLGNGNGHIEHSIGLILNGTANYEDGEVVFFWQDLKSANMLNAELPVNTPAPLARIGQNNFIVIDDIDGINTFLIQNRYCAWPHISTANGCGKALTPMEAYKIDSKLDDGLPLTGKVTNHHVTYGDHHTPTTAPADGYCNIRFTQIYNISVDAYANNPSCYLSIKFGTQ